MVHFGANDCISVKSWDSVFYSESNLRLDEGSIQWHNLEQCQRDEFTRRAMLENEEKKARKAEKDKEVASYKETGPMGSTDPYIEFMWF